MGEILELVPLDIETTGFAIHDEVTVIGFEMPLGCRVFVQTDTPANAGTGSAADAGTGTGSMGTDTTIEDAVRERAGHHVVVSTHATEGELLVATWEFVGERLRGEDVLLVGYNAETWQGGFDLPFLRSRYAAQAIKTLCMELGCDPRSVAVERKLTDEPTTQVDVKIEQPVPIVVEVYHRSRHGAMYRKLQAIMNSGYSCYVICVVDGACQPRHTPAEFNRSLQQYGPIEVGRYAPLAQTLTLGTKITEDIVDLVPPHRLDNDDLLWG